MQNTKENDKECKEKINENKVLSHHTKNLLKEVEMEEKELVDEICNNLED